MEEMTVTQVAEKLGKTDRTIRNYIKEGRIKARRIENQFGWEYRVYDLGEFAKTEKKPEDDSVPAPEASSQGSGEKKAETALQIISRENQRLWDENRQLREINNRLAYDLGGRDQKIKDLEQALEKARNLLTTSTPSASEDSPITVQTKPVCKPWWKRLFRH